MKFQRIQDLRVDSDLSQKQIGEILHISQRSYSHYETGSRDIPVEMLIRLADYYNISLGAQRPKRKGLKNSTGSPLLCRLPVFLYYFAGTISSQYPSGSLIK